MRPITLTMSAFSCYADEQTIHFDQLGQEGLYLIAGDTGSGKTTIFDALTFALYGVTSGDNRDAGMLRSKYASEDTPTYVEFVFKYHDKKYTIRRNPTYERPKRSGEGTTEEKANAELHLPDGRVVTRLREVNQEVGEILGINREQFVQIAMIAQGEFLKVLHTSTEDRIEIFRKIFYTDIYKSFQDRVRQESNDLAKRIREQQSAYEFRFNGVSLDPKDHENIEKLDEVKLAPVGSGEASHWLKEIILADKKSSAENDGQLEKLDKKLANVNQRLGQGEQDKKARDTLEEAKKRLPLERVDEEKVRALLKLEEENQPKVEGIKIDLAEIEKSLPRYKELEELIAAIGASELRLVAKNAEIKDLGTKEERWDDDIKAAKKEQGALADSEVRAESLKNKKDRLKTREGALKGLDKALADYGLLNKSLKRAQAEYKASTSLAEEGQRKYEALNKAYLDEQAGILAAGLKEGEACPVCGSLEHVKLATLSDQAPSKAILDRSKKEAETATKGMAKASQLASQLMGELGAKKDELVQAAANLLGDIAFEGIEKALAASREELEGELAKTREELAKEKEKTRHKKELDENLPSLEKELEKIKEAREKARQELARLEAQIEGDKKARDSQAKELKFKGENQAQEEMDRLKARINTYELDLKIAREKHEKARSKTEGTARDISTLEAQLKDSKPLDIEKLKLEGQELKDSQKLLNKANQSIGIRISTNQSVLEAIDKISKELIGLEDRYRWLKELSDTVNGDISGQEKIKLETYVQAAYFDRIVARANVKLLQMSGNQYELKRRDVSGKQGQSGLDLNVIDHYNGTERDAKTLSGGESFIAALSLALGLSDEIQSNAGGIRIDSMFVDEGFDSLDDGKLTKAIQTLMGISKSNRLIGIISHVAGLEDKIDRKIVVTKQRSGGSRAELVLN